MSRIDFINRQGTCRILFSAVALVFLIWHFLLPFVGPDQNRIISYLLASLLVSYVSVCLIQFRTQLQKLNRASKTFFICNLVIWSFYLLIFYPGIFTNDFFNLVMPLSLYQTNSWFSHTYSLVVTVLQSFGKNYFAVSLFAFFLIQALVVRMLSNFPISSIRKAVGMTLLFNLPILHIFVFLVYRDVLVSLFSAFLILIVCEVKNDPRFDKFKLFEIMIITFFTALLRIDAVHYLLLIPIVLALALPSWRRLVGLSGIAIVSLYLSLVGLWSNFGLGSSRFYQLSGLKVPLNAIVRAENVSITNKQIQKISKVLEYEQLKSIKEDYTEINLSNGMMKSDFTDQQWSEFLLNYVDLVWQNKLLFLNNRMSYFLATTGVWQGGYFLSDNTGHATEYFAKHARSDLSIQENPVLSEIKFFYYSILDRLIFDNENTLVRICFGSFYLIISVMLIGIVSSQRRGFFLGVFCILLSKNLLVFLTAPSPHFNYYGNFLFPCLVVIGVMLSESDLDKGRV